MLLLQLSAGIVCFPGGLFSKTEMSEVLTEILKADPTFDKDSFLKQCEKDIIPNILEVNTLFPSLFLLLSIRAACFVHVCSQLQKDLLAVIKMSFRLLMAHSGKKTMWLCL